VRGSRQGSDWICRAKGVRRMAWSRRRFAILACVLGSVTLAIGIGVATAATLKTKSASTTVGPSPDSGAVAAKCKKGSEAVSGGFDNPDFDPEFFMPSPETEAAIFNFASVRQSPRKWEAAGQNSGDGAGELGAFAYCDKSEPGLKAKSKVVALQPDVLGSGSVKCAKKRVAVSGGYASVDPLPGFGPLASKRAGKRKWTVKAYGAIAPSELIVFVYCDKTKPKLKTKSASVSVAANEDGSATARCKKGSSVVSGGFDGPGAAPDEPTGDAIYPYESRRTGKRKWTASGWNDEEVGTFVVYAYCEEKKK
jgi:hypothetical protein